MTDRTFARSLLAIAAAGLIPALVHGHVQFIDFDGWWHLFISTQDRWMLLLAEWKYEAHPLLYYLLLRLVAHLGHAHLILRSLSILSGCASTYVIGLIAARIYRSRVTALLLAAAYALSWSMIEINGAVRGYALALLFVLLAFHAYLDWATDPAGSRAGKAILRFGAWSFLALLSEYYVIFFLAACLCVVGLRVILRPAFRAAFLDSLRRFWKQWLLTTVSLAALFAGSFLFHMIVKPQQQHFLDDYYYREDSPLGLGGFLLSTFEKEVTYFSPFNLDPDLMLAFIGLFIVPALIYFLLVRGRQWPGSFSADPPLVLAVLVAQLVPLSLVGAYPFGGELRQQSIILPFVFLTAFLVLDRLCAVLKTSIVKNVLFAAAGVCTAAAFIHGWIVYPWDSVEPKTAQYRTFQATFPAAENIYGDVTSLIFYYAQNNHASWTFQDWYIVGGQRIVVYRVDDGSGHPIRILRNKRQAFLDLQEAETYITLAEVLRHENLKSAVLFYDGLGWDAAGGKVLENKFRTLAPLNGLDVGPYSFGSAHAFIEFKLK